MSIAYWMNSCGSGHWTNGSSSWDATVIFSGPGPWVQVQARSLYEWDFTDLTVTGTPSASGCEFIHWAYVDIGLVGYVEAFRRQQPVGQPCVNGGVGPLYETGTLTTAPVWVQTGVPVTLRMRMTASAAMGEGAWTDTVATLRYSVRNRLPTTGPIFILPEGYTANSPDLGIVNNRFGPVTITAATPQSFLDSLISVPGDLILADDADIASLSLPNLTSVGGDIIITGNTSLTTVGAPALEEVDGSIEIDTNPALEVVDFGALGLLSGSIVVTNNDDPQIDMGGLIDIGGDFTIVNNNDPQIDMGGLIDVGGDFTYTGNAVPVTLSLPNLTMLGGSFLVFANPELVTLYVPLLETIDGSIEIDTNPALEVVDFGALGGTTGSIIVSGNGDPQIDFGSLGGVTGSIIVSSNGDPQIDFGSLGGVTGSITITDNNSSLRTGSLSFPALISVGGDLTVDTVGQPVLDFANAIVGGNTLLSGIGTGSIAARTAAGTTDILLGGLFSTHAIALPVGALLDPTPLTAHALEGEELDPAEGLDAQGQPATIDPLAGVRYIFGDATFTQPALVQITLDVEQLDEPLRTDALAAMAAGRLTMAVKGDGAGDVHRARTICPEGSGPETDGCIGIVLYDGEGMVIPWSSEDAPAFIQATALVTQFSGWTLSIVGSSCPADVNGDGELDVLDFLDYLDAFGQCEGQPVDCTVYGVKANFNGDDIIDVLDILDFFDAFGTGCG
ncbi:MAG: hypothetical protein KIT19_06965 [Phycisphaeraceae bacterium]|nr:hypothetical protein [Phycisphaeraceae bacterium]